jgi:phospholipid transport system substrate-binding protein
MVQLFGALLAMLALTFSSAAAYAGAATDAVKAKQATLFDLLKAAPPDQKKIDGIFDEMLDYDVLAQNSLGDEWAKRSDAEKGQFTDLLKKLVRQSYQRNLKKIADYDVKYLDETDADGGAKVLKTTSKTKTPSARGDDEAVQINFKVVSKGGTWKIQDIVTEDVSLVTSYRSQFVKVIGKDGFPALLQKMKDKLAKGDTN